MDDDMLLADMELSITSVQGGMQETSMGGHTRYNNSPSPDSPSQLDDDGTLAREVDANLDSDRKAIVSILRNKNRTPIVRDSYHDETPLSPSPNNGSSLRQDRPPMEQRECCILL